jgi:hypothetical protein
LSYNFFHQHGGTPPKPKEKTMRKLITLRALSVIAATFPGCAATAAETQTEGPQVWKGTGALFAQDGSPQSQYTVELTRNPMNNGEVDQQIKVLIPEREPMLMSQRLRVGEKSFEISSDSGNGGGLDLGDGFITTYMTNDDGVTFASSIFMNGDEMRIFRYELKDGQAVRFFREAYTRQ